MWQRNDVETRNSMKEIDVQELINMNYRVITLLGMATSIVMDYKNLETYHDQSEKCNWFIQAINDVIYFNKPIPPLP